MRQFILILTLSIFILSCGQDANKQKELELKERELALKEKELALKEKGISGSDSLAQKTTPVTKNLTPTPKVNTVNKEQAINNVGEIFLGCWYWDGFVILEVRPKGVLIIHRLDITDDNGVSVKQIAGYEIVGTKIIFTNNTLLMSYYHIESVQNETFLVEEYQGNPGNRFKKVDCKNYR